MNVLARKITCPDLDTVRDLVWGTGIDGEWTEMENHCQFRADSGAILNFWRSTGTINFQGPGLAAEEFKTIFLKHRHATAAGKGPAEALLPDGYFAGP
jgi:hypothetical protein